jgi:phosphate transport system substrate-binding protein
VDTGAARGSGGVDLTGAGATFPYPLYDKWSQVYAAEKGIRVNYQSVGSGAGVQQLVEGTVDFGATDGPMGDAEMAAAKGGPILHIPMTLGADAITYNLPGVTQPLRMTGDIIADIFLGKITKWNDPRLTAVNPGIVLPARDVLTVHRSDGSGTTYVFTDYLTAVSPAWASGPGRGRAVNWPVGLGGRGNEGVAAQVQQTEGAVGYVELSYALTNRMPVAHVRNAAGRFVEPTVASMAAAAASGVDTLTASSDFRISIVNAPDSAAYPIASFTWILVYRNQTDADKGRKLVDFLEWGITDGQQYAPPLHYAPLPSKVVDLARPKLDSVKVGAP